MRLDTLLAAALKNFSRSLIQHYIKEKGIQVNGTVIRKPHWRVADGNKISFDKKAIDSFLNERAEKSDYTATTQLPILVDLKGFFAINKPPGVTSESLTKGVFPVHRLDKDTSGVLIAARNLKMQHLLQLQWQARTVRKKYIALIKGRLLPKAGAIEAAIGRSVSDRKKMAVSGGKGSRSAYTEYKVKKYFTSPEGPVSLVEAYPKTGRTHQIRIHFKSIGMPIVGDKTYGDEKLNDFFRDTFGLERQFLHAAELQLKNPKDQTKLTIKSPLPSDLSSVLTAIRSK